MKKQFFAYLHTHWDLEWYRDIEDFNLRFLDIFDIVLDELQNKKAPFFYLDGQVCALINYLKYRQDKKEQIIEFIKEKKLAIGPYYVSSDSYLVSFCSMLKNLELGLKFSKEFHQKDFIGYACDIFGISKSLFCALELNSIDKAIIWRGVNPKSINNNVNFKQGNIKTTWLAQGYFNDSIHCGNIDNIKKYLDKISIYSPDPCLLPIGGDHLGILLSAIEKIRKINEQLKDYEIILTSPFEYFKQSKFENISKNEEFLDNSNTYILSGVYSSRIQQKIKNNSIENKLTRLVEPLNFYLKDNYTKQIEDIYKTLLKNHAHDGIYGCSIDNVHKCIDYRLLKCELALNALLKRMLGNFKKKYNIKGKSKDKIGLFNLSNFNSIKTVELELPYKLPNAQILSTKEAFPDDLLWDIYKIPITEEICTIYKQLVEVSDNEKFSFNTVSIKKPEKIVAVKENSIENNHIKLVVKNKQIFVIDKKTKEKISLNLIDTLDSGDSYNFCPKGNEKALELISSKILYTGQIESCLRIQYKNIYLDIKLNNNSRFIEFYSTINNKKKNHKIDLVITLNENIDSTIAQDAIGTIKRKIDYNYNMKSKIPIEYPYELKTNTYPMQSFVIAKGITVLTKGLNEYGVYKNKLKICLLRAFNTISNPKNKTRSIPAGPDLKTPDAQCLGENKANFALMFEKKEQEAFFALDAYNKNYTALAGEFTNELNIKFSDIESNSYIYGISNNKKISYNLVNKKISLI